ncbi:TPA: phage tail tape measure protein [Burkholderia vietnamiensis]|nr:phage tail tape measure protein [Burkholderia vietnamiensis]
MSNNTQYNLTVNADGVYAALERAQKSYDRFGVTVDLAAQKAAASQKAMEEAITNTGNSSVRSQRQVSSFMNSLVQQSATVGMSREQMLEWAAAQRGVSDAAKPFIDNIRATQAAMQQQAAMARAVAVAENDLANATQTAAVQRAAAANLATQAAAAKGKEAESLRAASARAMAIADAADRQKDLADAKLNYQAQTAAASKAGAVAVADAKRAEALKTVAASAGAAERFRAWNAASQAAVQAAKSANDAQIANQRATDAKLVAEAKDTALKVAAAQAQAVGGTTHTAANMIGGISAGQHAAAMRMVPAQFTDIVTQLQGGANPLTVLMQQGGQLKDMFGSVAGAAKGMATYIASLFTPITIGVGLVVGALGAVGIAMYQGAKDSENLNRSIKLTGNYAGVTAGQMTAMADALRSIKGHGEAMDAINAVVGSGRVGNDAVQSATKAILDYAAASNQSAADAAAAVQPMFENPAEGAAKLNESMHFLTAAQYEQIKAMQEAGNTAGAQDAAFKALDAAVRTNAENAGYLAKAWQGVKSAIAEAWGAMQKWGAETTPEQELAKAKERLSSARRAQGGGVTLFGGSEDMYANDIEQAQKDVAAAQAKVDKAMKDAAKKATDAQVAQAGINAQRLADAHLSNTQKRINAAKDANDKYQTAIAKMRASGTYSVEADKTFARERDETIAEANRQYKEPKGHRAAGVKSDAADTMLRAAQETQATLQAQLDTREKIGAEAQKLIKFETQIRDIEARRAAGKKLADSDKQLLAGRQAVEAALKQNAELERQVEAQNELNKLKERGKQIDADILNYQRSQAEQYEAQLQAVGLGRKEQQRIASERAIRQKYLQEQAKLDKETPDSLRNSDEYLAAQQRIARGQQQSLEDNRKYYADMDALQSDWTKGVTQGWADYADAAANNMALAQTAFTDTTNTLQQTFDTFVKTGKLNFADMTRSILSDLAKIAAQKAIVGLVNMGVSAVSGFMGGGGDIPAGTASTTTGMNQYGFHLATGGAVSGPGTSTSDSIPAWLSDGEYVVKAAAVDRIGVHALDALNAGHSLGSVARFASGGAVGSVARATRPVGGNTTLVDVTVNAEGGGLDASDVPGLKADIQALIDARIAQKMKGQGGYAWQMANGSV